MTELSGRSSLTAEFTHRLITCIHSKEANKQQVCVCRLNLISCFMLVMISICFADGKAGDSANQADEPHSEIGALTPEEEYDDYKSQVDTCPPPFTLWFGGTACLRLVLACACCIFVQHPRQLPDFSMQAAVPRVPMSFVMRWCMTLLVKCLMWRGTK